MLLPYIWEVRLVGVFEPNVPNRERVLLQATQATDMGQFFLTLGVPTAPNTIYPVRDVQFWFGGLALNVGDWVMVFTGSGQPEQKRDPMTGQVIHTMFWGHDRTLFIGAVVPVLIRAGGILVGGSQPVLPEGRDQSRT